MLILIGVILGASGVAAASPVPSLPVLSPGTATPSPEPSATVTDLAPEPSLASSGVVLIVGAADTLTPDEARWLADVSAELGQVDVLSAAEATADRLLDHLVVYVIEELPGLDPAALADAYAGGRTIALAGGAAVYRARILASEPP